MKRKKLKVDLAELVFAMEMGDNMERSGYLDIETGEIIDMPDDIMRGVEEGRAESLVVDWDEELAEIAEKILGDEKNRFLPIPKRESRDGYEIMVSFTKTVTNKGLKEKCRMPLAARARSGDSGPSLTGIPKNWRSGMHSRMIGCGMKRLSGCSITASSRFR